MPRAHALSAVPPQQATHTLQMPRTSRAWFNKKRDPCAPSSHKATLPLHPGVSAGVYSVRGTNLRHSKRSSFELSGAAGARSKAAALRRLVIVTLSLMCICMLRRCCATSTCLASLRGEEGRRGEICMDEDGKIHALATESSTHIPNGAPLQPSYKRVQRENMATTLEAA